MRFAVLSFWLVGLFLLAGCGREQATSKNLEQIYAEQGIPVKVKKVQLQPFKKSLFYNALIRGFKESSAYAALGDRVEKIYVKVGDYVQKDQVLLSFPTDNPAARYYQAKVAFENAQRTLQRMKQLWQSGGISQQEYDNAQTQFEVTKANWLAVKQAVKVKAPISGYVTKINVQETDNVDVKAELFTITQTDRMKAEIWVAENEIGLVHPGQKAIARWNGYQIEGKVVQVNMAMDLTHRAFKAMLEFQNPNNTIKSGVTAEIELITLEQPQALVVERTALLKDEHGYYVYLNDGGKARKQSVKIGAQDGTRVQILQGLAPGDPLVVEGQFLIKEGSKLNIIE